MNKTKKLALIVLGLIIANLIIFDGIVENVGKTNRPLNCEITVESDMRLCH